MELRYDKLYGKELREAIDRKPLAWVPVGILEKHGEHLPYGLDTEKAHLICLRLARKLGGIVLPASHLAGVHQPWIRNKQRFNASLCELGNFYLRPSTFRMLLEDTVAGLANLGFKQIVLYSGHYPLLQQDILEAVAKKTSRSKKLFVFAFYEWKCFKDGDHAGKWETSFFMGLNQPVRMNKVRDSQHFDRWPKDSPPSRAFGEKALRELERYFRKVLRQDRTD